MSSTFLDSDSDSHHSRSSDSNDDDLPTYDICSPAKQGEICKSPTITITSSSYSTYSACTSSSSSSRTFYSSSPASQPKVKQSSPQKPLHLSGSSSVSSSPPLPSTPSPYKRRCLASSSGGSFSTIMSSSGGVRSKLSTITSPGCAGSRLSAATSSTSYDGGCRLSESPSASPLKLMERYGKTLHQHNKLTKKVENLTANIKTRTEKKRKLEKYRSRGGICGLSCDLDKKDMHSLSSEGEDELKPPEPSSFSASFRKQQQQLEADKFPLPLRPPGLPVLLHTPSLLSHLHPLTAAHLGLPTATHLHPPTAGAGRENAEEGWVDDEPPADKWTQQKPELLSQLICDSWFSLHYKSKPCPMILWEWLFQTTCLSRDQHIGQAALSNLTSLLECARGTGRTMWPVFVPTPNHVLQMLIALGADQKMLSETLEQTLSGILENTEDVAHSLCSPSIIANLSHLLTYLTLAVQDRPDLLSTRDIHSLIIMVATLSLDSGLLQQDTLQALDMSRAVSVLLEAIPEMCWPDSISFLTATIAALSSHHHNRLHLCKLLTPSLCRSQELQCLTCRHYLWMLLFPATVTGVPSSLPDWELAWRVIKHFHDQPSSAFHYYSMYSVMCMLRMLVSSSSDMNWPSLAKEGEFRDMLSNLALVRIKDHPDRTERVPVKDLLISFKLEMDSRKSKRTLHQMDLFSVLDSS